MSYRKDWADDYVGVMNSVRGPLVGQMNNANCPGCGILMQYQRPRLRHPGPRRFEYRIECICCDLAMIELYVATQRTLGGWIGHIEEIRFEAELTNE